MRFYLYRHISNDNVPFYIGIARKRSDRNWQSIPHEYERAFVKAKSARNAEWSDIARKGYSVEILFESDTEKEINCKEKEFVKLHGRLDLNTGTLVNKTDGGYGIHNVSLKTRKKISQAISGIKRSNETKSKISKIVTGTKKGPCSEATKMKISQKNSGSNNGMYGVHGKDNKKSKTVYQYDLDGNLLREWANAREIQKELGISYKQISIACIKGKYNYAKGFVWKHKKISTICYLPSRYMKK